MAYVFKLIYDNQSLSVKNDPIGWDEANYKIVRSKKDGHGTFKSFNLDLQWIKDGAQFIRDIYESEGIEALIKAEIYISNPNTFENELILSGKLNLTKYSANTDRGRLEITCPIEDETFQTQFLSLQDTDVNLNSDKDINGFTIQPAPIISSKLHSKSIAEEYEANMLEDVLIEKTVNPSFGGNLFGGEKKITTEFWIPLFMNEEIKSSLQKPFSLQYGTVTDLDDVSNFFQFDFDTKASIIANIPHQLDMRFWGDRPNRKVTCANSTKNMFESLTFEFYFEWRDKENTTKQLTLIGNQNDYICGQGTKITDAIGNSAITTDNYTKSMNIGDGSSLFNLPETDFKAGDKIYFYSYIKHIGNYEVLVPNQTLTQEFKILLPEHSQTSIKISGVSIFGATESEGVMVYEAFDQVIKNITGEYGRFKSDYFGRTDLGYSEDGPGSLRVISKGKNLRGFPIGQPISISGEEITDNLFMSFKSLMEEGFEGIDAISFGFEKDANEKTIVRVEPIHYFYDTDISITLESVSKLNKKAIADKYITNLNVGFLKFTGQKDIGTLFELNSEHKYYTGLKQLNKNEDKRTKLIAGSYAIESSRRLSVDLAISDGEYDEDIFVIQVLRNPDPTGPDYLSESNEAIESISGIQDAEGLYNIRLTPARILLNWGKVVSSSLFKNGNVNGEIRFASGKGNYSVKSKLVGQQEIKENGDLDASQFEPIWINEEYSFEYPLSLVEYNLLRQQTKKIIKFTDNKGTEFFGYIMEVEINLKVPGRSLSTFKLLRAK